MQGVGRKLRSSETNGTYEAGREARRLVTLVRDQPTWRLMSCVEV